MSDTDCDNYGKAAKKWKEIKSEKHVLECNLDFIRFGDPMPGYESYLDRYSYETSELRDQLYNINSNSIFTIDSQPGVLVPKNGVVKSDETDEEFYSLLRGYVKFGIHQQFEKVVLEAFNNYNIIVVWGVCAVCDDCEHAIHGKRTVRPTDVNTNSMIMCKHQTEIGIPVTIKGNESDIEQLTIMGSNTVDNMIYEFPKKYETTLQISIKHDDRMYQFLNMIGQTEMERQTQYITIIDKTWNNGSYIFDVLEEVSMCMKTD